MGRVVVRWVRVFSGWGRYLLGGDATCVPRARRRMPRAIRACHVRLEHRLADIGRDIGWGWEFSHGPLLNPRRESSRGGSEGHWVRQSKGV